MLNHPVYPVALITGAANGLGRELALGLARTGTTIAALDLQLAGLQSLEEAIRAVQGRCAWVVGDVTDAAGLQAKVAELEVTLGPIELLIANAGVGIETSALNYKAEDMNAVLGVNLLGVSNSIAAVLPGMLQRQRGHLVAISSLASMRGLPRMLGYCASKAGVNALMEGLRTEVGDQGIHVTTICPGWIRTAMTAQIGARLPRMLEVEDAARRILKAIHARRPYYAFPAATAWQLRLIKALPTSLADWLIRRMLGRLDR